MRFVVKLGFIASVLSLISCSNDFPKVPEMKFCILELDDDVTCNSVHVISESECEIVGGTIVPDTIGGYIPDICKKEETD